MQPRRLPCRLQQGAAAVLAAAHRHALGWLPTSAFSQRQSAQRANAMAPPLRQGSTLRTHSAEAVAASRTQLSLECTALIVGKQC
jgi:hypothetical protein